MFLVVNLALFFPHTRANAEEISNIDPSDEETTSYTPINYNGEFFSAINYQWTDTDGVEHQASLADEAKTWPQIQMFIQKIIDDQRIPGMVNDPTPEELRPDNGYIFTYGNRRTSLPAGSQVKVDWTQSFNEWGLPALPNANDERVDRTPYEDGLTAVLVKLNDDYSAKSNRNDYSSPKDLVTDNIKSMQVMTNRLRIEGNDNPGWLFNIRTPLNKFFIMTKGKLRSTVSRPFNWMFEQLSPAEDNNLPENVYEKMLGNTTFPILHDCRSVIQKYHPTLMGSKANTKDYVSSIMVYIPDKRFAKVLESQCTDQDAEGRWYLRNTQNSSNPIRYAGEDWTRDGATSFIYYNRDYTPVMMFNTIDLYAKEVILPAEDNQVPKDHAWVKLQWQSSVSKFLAGTDNVEKFQLFRVENGKKVALTMSEVQADDDQPSEIRDLIAENPDLDTVQLENGEIFLYHISRETGLVTAYVLEEQLHKSRQVRYLVEGTIAGSDVSDVESNTVEALIPGSSLMERCELKIVSNPTSQFVYQNDEAGNEADYNHYVHKLGLTNNPNLHYPLLTGHVKNETGDSANDTYFTLCRSYLLNDIMIDVDTNDEAAVNDLLAANNIVALQRLYIIGYEDREDGYTYFRGKIVDVNSGETLLEKDVFKSLTEDGKQGVLIGLGKDDDVWFTVTFDEATKDNLHPMGYCYRLFSNIKVFIDETDESGYACSSIISIDIPHTKLDTTFRGYTMDEILNDVDRNLAISGKQVVYRALDDVNVSSYMLIHNGANPMAVINRTQDGTYQQSLYSDDAVAAANEDGAGESQSIDFGEQRIDIVPFVSQAGGDIVCKIFDSRGNSYGSGRTLVPENIALDGSIRSLDGHGNESFHMIADGQVGDTEDNQRYLVANNLFNAWAISDDGSQPSPDSEEMVWDDRDDLINILNINQIVSGIAAIDEDEESVNSFQIDGTDLTFSHTYDYPTWNVGENSSKGEKPFVAGVMLRYYPEIIPVESYNPGSESSDSSESAAVQRKMAGETLYAVVEVPMAYTTYGNATISSVDSPIADPIQTVIIYSIQGIILARYRASGSDREILQASGLPAGNYIAKIGDRVVKANIR